MAFAFACSACGAVAADLHTPPTPASRPVTPILQELRAFRELGSVLYVAAHPDDENTQLITYLARGRGYRTGYLSLTRGDGGQNESGPEFGEKLGLARTWELLAARQLDGGHQFFTRALDFGYSKDVNETLRIWDRQQVLADVVRIIRKFRPDVVITRFSPTPSGTHGHHTASSVLARIPCCGICRLFFHRRKILEKISVLECQLPSLRDRPQARSRGHRSRVRRSLRRHRQSEPRHAHHPRLRQLGHGSGQELTPRNLRVAGGRSGRDRPPRRS
ncbi:MAG: PIG-L family deacetylase [Betaproteobacteria bacterium]|nr:PIG-L family deacetylase [Betaproteobacteria bacterium]